MYKLFIKRVIDFIFSVALMPILLPMILAVACFVKIEDGGKIFYSANRLGKNGGCFKMYKFRSMKMNAPDLRNPDGSTFNSFDDPRLTKVGRVLRRTSLDELPQIFNVFIGNMSFIGPRPDLPEQIAYYEEGEEKRLAVLPGISGYNQAYYRNAATWKQRIQNDIYYVKNLSFLLDIKILFKTLQSIFLQRGVYSGEEATKVEGAKRSV